MSQDREPRHVDLMHHYDERLNLIYRHWEAQIERQNAANRSQTLVGKIKSHKKTALAGIAIAFGSAIFACQYGKQINSQTTLIANNSQQLNKMTWGLQHQSALYKHLPCYQNGTIYQLISGQNDHHAFTKEPQAFTSQPETISVIKHSTDNLQSNAYLRLNPNRNLLFSSTEKTNHSLQTTAQVINLDQDLADLSGNQAKISNYTQIQEQAIALHEEFSQCLSNRHNLDIIPPFPQPPFAD